MNVLSLFDGMSCGQIALERAGIEVDNYYASEIDKYAIKVTKENYPGTHHLGSILDHAAWQLPEISLIIGGSPCQDLSRIKSKDSKHIHGEKSRLFFKYVEALEKHNPKYFLLENVVMNEESERTITNTLGVEPVLISSAHFSAQDRPRLYWTNIPFDKNLPNNTTVIKDILEPFVDEKYFYDDVLENFDPSKRQIGSLYKFYPNGKRKMTDTTSRVYNIEHKAPTLTAVSGGHQEKKVYINGHVRKLTPLEYERLQTVPEGYTASASDSQRWKMLGNGWTVDVIAHILRGIKK
jgi:DNA-cytosine methyltransferase